MKSLSGQFLENSGSPKADVDSYNENRCPDNPIQMIFDFTLDLAELEAAAVA